MTPATGRVLVAGVGNIFLGDDGFGVEVVRRLAGVPLPDRVDVADYGIRGVHLAYDLLDGRHATLVLVDALPLGEPPGALGLLDVDLDEPGWTLHPADLLVAPAADGHGMDPEAVLRLLRSLGGTLRRVLVVGCQPAAVDERMAMSAPVCAALDAAVRLAADVARDEAARLDAAAAARDEAARLDAAAAARPDGVDAHA